MKRSSPSSKRLSWKRPRRRNDDGADDGRRYGSEQRAEGRAGSGAAGGGVAARHGEEGRVVVAGDVQDWEGEGCGGGAGAAGRGPLVRAGRPRKHVRLGTRPQLGAPLAPRPNLGHQRELAV